MELVKSAVANAEHNYKQNKKDLYISRLVVTEGATLKRARPVSRGRSHPILKRTSHITLEVAVRVKPTMMEAKKKKSEPVAVAEETTEASPAPVKKTAAPKKAPRAAKPKKESEPTT